MASQNGFEDLISEELTAQEQSTIAGGSMFDLDIDDSLLGNAIKMEDFDLDLDLDLTQITDSFNFGGNSVK